MSHHNAFVGLALVLFLAANVVAEDNVLLIIADDIGVDVLECFKEGDFCVGGIHNGDPCDEDDDCDGPRSSTWQ